MKKVSVIVLTLLLIGIGSFAFVIQQVESLEPPDTEWSRTFGGTGEDMAGRTGAGDVVQTSDDGYAIAGYTNSFGAGLYDFWLVKVDCDGYMVWHKTYGGTDNDVAECVVQTNDEGYAIVGWTESFGVGGDIQAWLVKTDSFGNREWNKTYGGPAYDWANYVIQTSDGGFAIAGETFSHGAGGADFWLIKTDSSGNVMWMEAYGGAGDDVAYCVIQVSDGGYALVGRTRSFGAGRDDFWFVKTDSNGKMEWDKTYGGSNWEMAESVVQTDDGGYAIVGFTESFGAGDEDFWFVKTDSNGNIEWNKTYGGRYIDHAYSVVQTTDQGYAITGRTQSFGAGRDDFWLVKTDLSGNIEWNQTYGGIDSDDAYSVIQTDDGGYAMAGKTLSFGAGQTDFWLVKLVPATISATVDVDPDTLNLKSNGEWITAYIEPPECYDVSEIDVGSILLNDTVPVDVEAPTTIGDYDLDAIPDLMVKFDRAVIIEWLNTNDYGEDTGKYYEINLTITGKVSGTKFTGTDQVKVLKK